MQAQTAGVALTVRRRALVRSLHINAVFISGQASR